MKKTSAFPHNYDQKNLLFCDFFEEKKKFCMWIEMG